MNTIKNDFKATFKVLVCNLILNLVFMLQCYNSIISEVISSLTSLSLKFHYITNEHTQVMLDLLKINYLNTFSKQSIVKPILCSKKFTTDFISKIVLHQNWNFQIDHFQDNKISTNYTTYVTKSARHKF